MEDVIQEGGSSTKRALVLLEQERRCGSYKWLMYE